MHSASSCYFSTRFLLDWIGLDCIGMVLSCMVAKVRVIFLTACRTSRKARKIFLPERRSRKGRRIIFLPDCESHTRSRMSLLPEQPCKRDILISCSICAKSEEWYFIKSLLTAQILAGQECYFIKSLLTAHSRSRVLLHKITLDRSQPVNNDFMK